MVDLLHRKSIFYAVKNRHLNLTLLILIMKSTLFLTLSMVLLVIFASTPVSLAQNSINHIDINNATLEGTNVQTFVYQVSPVLNYLAIDYTVNTTTSDFVVNFSANAKPQQSLISPSAICKPLTTPLFLVFVRLDGYNCNFGSVSQGTKLHIVYQNTATTISNLFSFIGV